MSSIAKINYLYLAQEALTKGKWNSMSGGACRSCSVDVDSRRDFVKKQFDESSQEEFEKELKFLTLFSGTKHFPKVVYVDPTERIIVMRYHGSMLTSKTCPANFKNQLQHMLASMESKNVYHNDVYSRNIVVDASGTMTLIDFGWATQGRPGQYHMNMDAQMIAKSNTFDDIVDALFLKRRADESLDHPRIPEIHTLLVWNPTPRNIQLTEAYIAQNLKPHAFTILYKGKMQLTKSRQKALCQSIYGGGNRVVGDAVYLCIVRDKKPVYRWARATACEQVLNVNMKTHKEALRKLLGGSIRAYHCAHTSYNVHEALQVLKPLKLDFAVKRPTFKSFSELFARLNSDLHLKYVVLRSFEEIKNPPQWFANRDIDVLVSDYYHFKAITGARCINVKHMRDVDNGFRIQNKVIVAGVPVAFDVRFVGDNYVDSSWEHDILSISKTMTIGETCTIRVPSARDHFYALLYHVLVHKPHPERSKHGDKLKRYLKIQELPSVPKLFKILKSFLDQRGYTFRRPVDKAVGFYMNSLNSLAN